MTELPDDSDDDPVIPPISSWPQFDARLFLQLIPPTSEDTDDGGDDDD